MLTTMLDTATIRLTGEIDMAAAFGLIDELRLLSDYYQFRTVTLEIDSPGGHASALLHIVNSIRPWMAGEKTLKTVGVFEVASAAAMLLSCGTVGHRYVHPYTQLLYHHGRVVGGTVATAATLKDHSRRLASWDSQFVSILSAHSSADPRTLQKMFAKDKPIKPTEARAFGLIDHIYEPTTIHRVPPQVSRQGVERDSRAR